MRHHKQNSMFAPHGNVGIVNINLNPATMVSWFAAFSLAAMFSVMNAGCGSNAPSSDTEVGRQGNPPSDLHEIAPEPPRQVADPERTDAYLRCADYLDADNDGIPEVCSGSKPEYLDCDGTDPSVNPDAVELPCDLKDTDCNGLMRTAEADRDSDGVAECMGDCDDLDPDRAPGFAEVCDDQDNDCDPATLDGAGDPAFNDSVDCTADACVGGVLVHAPQDNLCDDGQACTDNVCNPATGCEFNADDTNNCDNGLFCDGVDTCSAGACVGGPPVDCNDNNECTSDSCDEASFGGCINDILTGNACDDGVGCTVNDTCLVTGACQGAPDNGACSDGDDCTLDACIVGAGCQNPDAPAMTACSDGNACTTADVCDGAGVCNGGPALNCDDANQCTVDSCDVATGCVNNALAANGNACSDGSVCTVGDTCNGLGACASGAPLACEDNNACTDNTCDAALGCQFVNDDSNACSDGDLCTQTDTCSAGACVGNNPVVCSALDQCHDPGACDPATGMCSNPERPDGTPCDDGAFCTDGDACLGGGCNSGSPRAIDDNVGCTVDLCDEVSNLVSHMANDAACDDVNVCTDDSCDVVLDCQHTDNTAPCDDGSACTANDTCAGGSCSDTTPVVCDDANPCTDDACDPATGCTVTNNTDPCVDGNACTFNDTCGGGVCTGMGGCAAGTTCNAATMMCEVAANPCGLGTHFDAVTSTCVPDVLVTCGPGTTLNPATSVCEANCGAGTSYDAASGSCVADPVVCPAGSHTDSGVCVPDVIVTCGPGTTLDPVSNVCEPNCGTGTSYDAASGSCVSDSPVTCGAGTVDDGAGNCRVVEVCNGVDDDGDTLVDEGFAGLTDLCDGIDDDCDGLTDEDLTGGYCCPGDPANTVEATCAGGGYGGGVNRFASKASPGACPEANGWWTCRVAGQIACPSTDNSCNGADPVPCSWTCSP